MTEAAIVQQAPEGLETQATLTDVLVTVHPRPHARFRVVYVQRHEPVPADDPVELPENVLHAAFRRNIVTGSEEMGRIETNAQTLRLADIGNYVGEVFESMAETRTLARSRFEGNAGFDFRKSVENMIDRFNNFCETCFLACAEMSTRMQNQKW